RDRPPCAPRSGASARAPRAPARRSSLPRGCLALLLRARLARALARGLRLRRRLPPLRRALDARLPAARLPRARLARGALATLRGRRARRLRLAPQRDHELSAPGAELGLAQPGCAAQL